MSCMRITAYGPQLKVTNVASSRHPPAVQLRMLASPIRSIQPLVTSARHASKVLRYQRVAPMCLFGDKGKPKGGNEDSPWKALEKAMGGLKKELTVQDVLREQIQKQELGDNGGGPGSPPGGGSGGGSGGSEEEDFAGIVDEFVQVILATIGFIFLYIYIIDGEELTRLAKDYIRYLFTRKTSVRLRRAMFQWERFYEMLTRKDEYQPDWLEREILNTPTRWYNPAKYKRQVMAYQEPSSSVKQSDNEDATYQYNEEDEDDFY
ncbi:hypothetical protein Scep_010935 [Stephania cephalantha]|uniref:Uncharacterized protein n=1 Tax=Stephania cephalantha TaxID=152367 RepID=A0AAP0JWT6_9MAGN